MGLVWSQVALEAIIALAAEIFHEQNVKLSQQLLR